MSDELELRKQQLRDCERSPEQYPDTIPALKRRIAELEGNSGG